MDFHLLYAKNCAGCHGPEGKGGAAIALGDPVFLAIADDARHSPRHRQGVPGTPMPAFAQSAGGMLTDEQIDAIVSGIRSLGEARRSRATRSLPPYAAPAPGDPTRGADVYATYCSSCHGPDGRGGSEGQLHRGRLVSRSGERSGLRTTVIVGRPELGAPDWRNNVPGKPMSAQEVTDVVAWLAAQRPQLPGPAVRDTLPRPAPTRAIP